MKNSSNIRQILQEEIVANYKKIAFKNCQKPAYIIAHAWGKLGIDHDKAKSAGGWICGNFANSICNRLQMPLKKEWTEEALDCLISFCISGGNDIC